MQGNQRTARECYLVSIQPLLEWVIERGPVGPLPPNKRPRTRPSPPAAEALVIHTALGIWIFVMVTTLMRRGFVVLVTRGPSLASQRHSLLAILLYCRWVELHQLGVLPLGLAKMAILHILDIHLKVAFYAEGIGCQSHQKLPKELGTLVVYPLIALVLGFPELLLFGRGLRAGVETDDLDLTTFNAQAKAWRTPNMVS
ncbi:LOW QUALITY PROTEIN: hypothetical protein Cgig2_019763 [Carnegiea gigantea]|uniref:Uncharacterized protein n=1 Tax=Carnegiea gigantea TaxID=171969 RepID=A0A9Q1QNJ6_9CARY|nr:LOW QUALITY PROTEIN: hypothetical protein Cgig2_019763 [Carnegiea gigantea]